MGVGCWGGHTGGGGGQGRGLEGFGGVGVTLLTLLRAFFLSQLLLNPKLTLNPKPETLNPKP